jgi:TonB family protein
MFNNLIESSSHRSEMKRRGSFFLFTVASYALLFVIAGVASIYAYDARMEDHSLEVVIMTPVNFPKPERLNPERAPARFRSSNRTNQLEDVRRNPTAPVNQPTLAPENISATPNPDLPVRGAYRIGTENSNALLPSGDLRSGNEGSSGAATQVVEVITPPPDPTPRPSSPKIIKSQGVLNGHALDLPKPSYPAIAKQMRVQGRVNVQVLIDETGNVIYAQVIDGPPLLKQVSEKAAYQARFSPTKLGDQPVKVSGVIIYNFVLQ